MRRLIETTARGQPEYDRYSPVLAEATRNQIGVIQPMLAAMGPIQSVIFRGPAMLGGDSFEVTFAKGAGMWSIRLSPDGKVESAGFSPAPAPPPAARPAARKAVPTT